jgi:hypothetical protein
MNFYKFQELLKEAWIIDNKSKETYEMWKESIKKNSQFLRINWRDALKIIKKVPGQYEHYYKLQQEKEGWADEEWTAKYFIKDKSDIILAKVDACEFMKTRTLTVTNPDPSFYEKEFSEKDIDPGLPLAMVTPEGVMLYDGNHRMQAACKLNQPGYVAIGYFMNYDAVKHTIMQILN